MIPVGSKVPIYSDMAMEFEVLKCPEIPMDSGTSICPETHDKVEIKMII